MSEPDAAAIAESELGERADRDGEDGTDEAGDDGIEIDGEGSKWDA